jgi:hypothetical protein
MSVVAALDYPLAGWIFPDNNADMVRPDNNYSDLSAGGLPDLGPIARCGFVASAGTEEKTSAA